MTGAETVRADYKIYEKKTLRFNLLNRPAHYRSLNSRRGCKTKAKSEAKPMKVAK